MDKKFKVIFLLFGMLLFFIIPFSTRSSTVFTEECAAEVAVNYIGRGSVTDVALVTEEYAIIYAVDISYENFQYVVYVDGEAGEVVWLDREVVEHKR